MITSFAAQTQDNLRWAVAASTKIIQEASRALPNPATDPYAFVDPQVWIDRSYDFSAKVLEVQRELAHRAIAQATSSFGLG